MKFQKHNKHLIILIMLIMSLSLTACGASVEKLNKRGNEAFTRHMYEEALVAYQAAQIESPELAEPYYNAANTLYRQGNYAEAVKQLSYALSFADKELIQQSGLYNLGNNAYNNQELESAVKAYKGALLIDPHDQDAKYNLELALQQQEQQQQQEQEQQEDQEQNQDQESNGEDQNESGDNQQEGEQDQDSESSKDQGGGEDKNDNQSQQQNEENQGDQGNQSDQEQGEGQLQDQEGNNQDQNGQNGQVPAPGERMTAEQAQQLLAAIAQDMETLQERLGQVLFVQDLPPIQDW